MSTSIPPDEAAKWKAKLDEATRQAHSVAGEMRGHQKCGAGMWCRRSGNTAKTRAK